MEPSKVIVLAKHAGANRAQRRKARSIGPSFYSGPWVLLSKDGGIPVDAMPESDAVDAALNCGLAIHPREFLYNTELNAMVAFIECVIPPLNGRGRWVLLDDLQDEDAQLVGSVYAALSVDDIRTTSTTDDVRFPAHGHGRDA